MNKKYIKMNKKLIRIYKEIKYLKYCIEKHPNNCQLEIEMLKNY